MAKKQKMMARRYGTNCPYMRTDNILTWLLGWRRRSVSTVMLACTQSQSKTRKQLNIREYIDVELVHVLLECLLFLSSIFHFLLFLIFIWICLYQIIKSTSTLFNQFLKQHFILIISYPAYFFLLNPKKLPTPLLIGSVSHLKHKNRNNCKGENIKRYINGDGMWRNNRAWYDIV